MLNNNAIDLRKQIKNNSAKKASDGVSNLMNIIMQNLGNDTSRGNASTIYNIIKMFE